MLQTPSTGRGVCNMCELTEHTSSVCVDDYIPKNAEKIDLLIVASSLPLDILQTGGLISKSPAIIQIYKIIKELYPNKVIAVTSTCKCPTRVSIKNSQIRKCAETYFPVLMGKIQPERLLFLGAQSIEMTCGLKKVARGITVNTMYGKAIVAGTINEITHDPMTIDAFKKDIKYLFDENSPKFDKSKFKVHIARSKEDLDAFYNALKDAPKLWWDIEGSTKPYAPSIHPHDILCMSFTKERDEAFVIPLNTIKMEYENREILEYAHEICRRLLQNNAIKVPHNGKYDVSYTWFVKNYMVNNYKEDTMLKAYLVDESQPSSLKALTNLTQPDMTQYDKELDDYVATHPECDPDKGGSYRYLPNSILLPYNGYDTIATNRIDTHFTPKLEANPKLVWLYYNVMMPVFKVYMNIEANGILFDRQGLEEETARLQNKVQENYRRVIKYLMSKGKNADINITAREQVAKLLIELGEITPEEANMTKSGKFSVDEDVINKLVGKGSELGMYINNIQKAESMDSKYVQKPLGLLDFDDRLHPEFGITTTDTGRSSSYGFNVQNITSKYRVFIIVNKRGTPMTRIIMKRDFSQLEIRMMASRAKVKLMLEIYKRKGDVHKLTAGSKLYLPKGLTDLVKTQNVDLIIDTLMKEFAALDKETAKSLRQGAKPSNFGFLYKGNYLTILSKSNTETDKAIKEYMLEIEDTQDANKIAELRAKIEYAEKTRMKEEEAKDFEQGFHLLYPEVREYHDECCNFAKKTGTIVSPFGRIKMLPEALLPETPETRARINHALNASTNMPIQSAGNELKFLSLIDIQAQLDSKPNIDAFLISEVHDEVVCDVNVKDAHVMFDLTEQSMNHWDERLTDPKLLLPIPSDAKVGLNYGKMSEVANHEELEKYIETYIKKGREI